MGFVVEQGKLPYNNTNQDAIRITIVYPDWQMLYMVSDYGLTAAGKQEELFNGLNLASFVIYP